MIYSAVLDDDRIPRRLQGRATGIDQNACHRPNATVMAPFFPLCDSRRSPLED